MQRRTGGRGLGAVLFTDIVGSTLIAAEMGNTRWGELVARHHRILRGLIHRFGGREIDTAGDGFFVVFERPADAIRCAVEATEAVRRLGIEIRAGVSFGELETVERKPGGLVVNTAARVMSVAGPGEVLVPASVKEIVPGAGITFAEHGVHQLKGLDGEFRLFGVTGIDGREMVPPLEAEEAAERRREIFPTGGRRRAMLVGVGAGVLALIVGAWLLLSGGSDEPKRVPGPLQHSVVRIDADAGHVGASSVFIGDPGGEDTMLTFIDHPLVVGQGGVWLLRPPNLLHIDPLRVEVRSAGINVGFATSQTVATGFDAVWVLSDRTLYEVHPGTDEVKPFLRLPLAGGIATYALALDNKHLWVGDSDGTVVRLDPATGAPDQAETGLTVDLLAATTNGLWVVDIVDGSMSRIDQESLEPMGEQIEIDGSIDQVVGSGDDLWILDQHAGIVTRADAVSSSVRDTARVGHDPTDIAIGSDAVWVGDLDGSLYRVDRATLEVREFPIGAEVLAVAVDQGAETVWAYVGSPTGSAAD